MVEAERFLALVSYSGFHGTARETESHSLQFDPNLEVSLVKPLQMTSIFIINNIITNPD